MRRFVLEMTACAALASGLALAQSSREAPPGGSASFTAASPLRNWLVDPRGEVDGVVLDDGRAFYFDPLVGKPLLLRVRIADPLRVDVRGGVRHLVNERDGSSVVLTPMARGGGPGPQPALARVTARGLITEFVRLPEGVISGFILSTGEQVRFAPSVGARLHGLGLQDLVIVRGFGTRGEYGTGMVATQIEDASGRQLL